MDQPKLVTRYWRTCGIWKRQFLNLELRMRCKFQKVMSIIEATETLHNIRELALEEDVDDHSDRLSLPLRILTSCMTFRPLVWPMLSGWNSESEGIDFFFTCFQTFISDWEIFMFSFWLITAVLLIQKLKITLPKYSIQHFKAIASNSTE